MKIIKTVNEIRNIVKSWRKEGLKIGLVPTMGYLHEGHESLIEKASCENDKVVVSIFVNPMQFGPSEDLGSYPRDLNHDSQVCERAGADVIFNPEPSEMYADGFCSFVDMTGLTNGLCGKSRPGHFRGVCTVVNKLFNIIQPDSAYFGQKDAQQLAVIKQMVRDLNIDIEIVGCPIVREKDGLAKSSRNSYLNEKERKSAPVINKALTEGQKLLINGERNAENIVRAVTDKINAEPGAKIDYVDVVNLLTLDKVNRIESSVLVAAAVYIGKTRLIDNFIYEI